MVHLALPLDLLQPCSSVKEEVMRFRSHRELARIEREIIATKQALAGLPEKMRSENPGVILGILNGKIEKEKRPLVHKLDELETRRRFILDRREGSASRLIWFFVIPLVASLVATSISSAISSERLDRSTQRANEFDRQLSTEEMVTIQDAIQNREPILPPKGSFGEGDLENLLGIYEDVGQAYNDGVVTTSKVCEAFSVGIIATYNHPDVKNYLVKEREDANEPDLYSGFKDLAKKMLPFQGHQCPKGWRLF